MRLLLRAIIYLFAVFKCSGQYLPVYDITWGDASASAGYYFINTMKPGSINPNQFNLMILDKLGNLVYTKNFNSTVLDFKLQPGGTISYSYTFSGNTNLKFFIMDSTFVKKDSVHAIGYNTDSHDFSILPNGHYLIMGVETRIMNLTAYNWFNGNGSPGSPNASILCGVIQELDENKNLLFTWKSADHYQFEDVQEQWLFSPNLVDWTHFNSLVMDNDGNILVSSRHFSEVTKINWKTGEIIWRMGGKNNQFSFINDAYNGFLGQHDARRIWNGNITIFDNGYLNAQNHPARGVEYSVNEQNHIAALVWSYNYSANSSRFLGSVLRLANGNNVIGWGGMINQNITLNSYKPNGNLIMGLSFPADTLYTYRAFNYTSLPWNFNRPQVTCSSVGSNYFLEAPQGYSSYKWSTGETTRIIQITVPDTYYVFVPYGQGGYISSERVIITSLLNVCQQVTGIHQIGSEIPMSFKLEQNYPNPFNPETKIRFQIPDANIGKVNVKLVIYNILGSELETLVNNNLIPGTYETQWSAGDYPSGVYYYKLTAGNYSETKKMILLK